MSAYEDKRLASRFAAVAPEPLPGDWDDVLDKAGAGRTGRTWRERSRTGEGRRRRRIAVLAAASLVAVVGTASAFSTVREFVLDRGFVGLPPVGAKPSAPESGELVLHWYGRSASHARPPRVPLVRAWVYADGRIIWDREGSTPGGANELTSGYLEQRLTPDGVELVRSAVVGLFGSTRPLLDTVPADSDPRGGPFSGSVLFVPPDSPFGWGSVQVAEGDRLVRLRWDKACPPRRLAPTCDEGVEGTPATPEQLSALRRVDALLTAPSSALPSSAWADREVRAFVPSHYAVCIDTSPPKDASRLLSLLPSRAADVLRGKSRTRLDGEVVEAREAGRTVVLGQSVTYCSKLTTEDAREVADALSGFDRETRTFGLAYRLAEPVNNLNSTKIGFDPYLPHGEFLLFGGGA
jgi:hypothetical protein